MLAASNPFPQSNTKQAGLVVSEGLTLSHKLQLEHLEESAWEILAQMIQVDPLDRVSARQVCESCFVQRGSVAHATGPDARPQESGVTKLWPGSTCADWSTSLYVNICWGGRCKEQMETVGKRYIHCVRT